MNRSIQSAILVGALSSMAVSSGFAHDLAAQTAATAEQAAPGSQDTPAAEAAAPEVEAAEAAVGEQNATLALIDGKVPAPPAGKGLVVFFRPAKLAGAALSFSIRENGEGVAKLSNGTYHLHVAEPGLHEYQMESEVKDTLRLEIEPDETYYVQQTINMGIMMGRPRLTPAAATDFKADKLKPTSKTATDKKKK